MYLHTQHWRESGVTCIDMASFLSYHYQILTENGGNYKTSGKNYLSDKDCHTIPKKIKEGEGKKKCKKSRGVPKVTKQGFIKKVILQKRKDNAVSKAITFFQDTTKNDVDT